MATIHITVEGDGAAAERLRAALVAAAAAAPSAPAATPAGPTCPICRQPAAELVMHKRLEQAICPLCTRAAERILGRFRADAERHYREVVGQLPQMIRDLRAGLEEPTFYRGWE